MADAPITTTVPETVTVDTGADKEQLGNLQADFSDFWAEQDSKADLEKTSDAPAAPVPSEGAAQETKVTASAEPKPAAPEAKPSTGSWDIKKDVTDDDIDKMELIPGQRPEVYQGFRQVKEGWKRAMAQLRAENERAKGLETQLAEARANSWTPEAKADYDHAASVRRRFDFVSDPDFIQRFHIPVRSQYEQILDEAVGMLPDQQAAMDWALYMKQHYQPDQLNKAWWTESVIDKVPNELDRTNLRDSVAKLLKMQKDRDNEVQMRTQDRSAFDNWINEKVQTTAKRVHEEIMTEIGEQEKRIQEVLPRDPEAAKTNEEKQAIAAHNERFQELNKFFVNTMQDLSKNGPRAWVRAAVEATRTQIMDKQIRNLEEELKTTKSQRDQYKSELDKITGVRRKISHTTGTPPTPTGSKSNNGQGLSIKNLDVRDAFKNYSWGDE
jgi:hypothetical protein